MKRFLTLAPMQIAQALAGLGAIAAFTRLMTPEEFGRYALALSASMLAHTLLFTWAEAAAFRFFSAARSEKRLADHFATLLALALVLGTLVLAATTALLMLMGLSDTTAIAAFAATAAALRFFIRIARESDRAALNATRYAALETLYISVGFAAGVAMLMVFDLGAAAPFAGLLLAGLLVALLDAPRLFARAKEGAPSLERANGYAAYGAPLAIALALDLGVQTLARFILAQQAGTAEVGVYAAAFGLARPIDLIFIGVGGALAPLLLTAYETNGSQAARAAARDMFVPFAAIAAPATVGLCLVAQPLASLMVGDALSTQAARVLPWLAIACLTSGFNLYYWSEAFQLTRRTSLRAIIMLAPAAVQITLTALLAANFGAFGAALAATAGAATGAILLAGVGQHLIALPAPLGVVARIAAASAVMAAAVLAMPAASNALSLALACVAGVFAYAIAAVAFDVAGLRARTFAFVRTTAAFQERQHARP